METTKQRANFDDLTVGAFESRKKDELERLIENLGGKAHVAASIKEVPVEEHAEVFQFADELFQKRVDMIILFTGVGTRALFRVLSSKFPIENVVEAFKRCTIVARGPKSVRALSDVGITPQITIPEPNTWREILKTLDNCGSLQGRSVAVQEYGESNRLFLAELVARGARVVQVPVYKAVLPDDTKPLRSLIHSIVRGDVDVLLFTNATQVEHAMAVAREEGVAQGFKNACARSVVASVGPTCSEMILKYGLPVDIEPERPMMGALVAAAAAKASSILEKKKAELTISVSVPVGGAAKEDPLQQSLFLKACRREVVARTPIWLMRQAGRYMKEYRELRAKVSFLELCKNSDLAAEVTVDAAHRLGVDAAIIFSDILIVVEPLGFRLSYGKDAGPEIANPFRTPDDVKRLLPVDVETSFRFVFDAIRKTRRALKPDLPLIGFCGAPFTVASYVIEGKGSKNFVLTKTLMYEHPEAWHALLEKITHVSILYLNAQIRAGAQAVQIFDSWVGALSPEDYRVYVYPHTRRLLQGISPGVPVIHFGTQTNGLLSLLRQAGGDVIGVDWRIELDEAWSQLGDVAIQGNMDPVLLLSTPEVIRAQARRILAQAGGRPGHIFNLGHGVLPTTPIENVLDLIETVKSYHAH